MKIHATFFVKMLVTLDFFCYLCTQNLEQRFRAHTEMGLNVTYTAVMVRMEGMRP